MSTMPIIPHRCYTNTNLKQVPTDGAVFKLDDLRLARLAGANNRAPKASVAFKFKPVRVETTLLAVHVGVGRQGTLAPRAELKPVVVDGAVVSAATLNNFAVIAAKDLRIGDVVGVERAGDVIPHVFPLKNIRTAAEQAARGPPIMAPTACTSSIWSGVHLYLSTVHALLPALRTGVGFFPVFFPLVFTLL
jgi:DNA ligase (NAD+)